MYSGGCTLSPPLPRPQGYTDAHVLFCHPPLPPPPIYPRQSSKTVCLFWAQREVDRDVTPGECWKLSGWIQWSSIEEPVVKDIHITFKESDFSKYSAAANNNLSRFSHLFYRVSESLSSLAGIFLIAGHRRPVKQWRHRYPASRSLILQQAENWQNGSFYFASVLRPLWMLIFSPIH